MSKKLEVLTVIKSLPTTFKKLPLAPINAANESLNVLVKAYSDYKITAQLEKTKRTAIIAWRDTKTTELNNQRGVLEEYLKLTFKERSTNIEKFFDVLDKGIESGDDSLIEKSIAGILSIAKDSPLAGARELMIAMRDPSVKSIEI